MAKEKQDLRKDLEQCRFDMGFLQKIDCSYEENKKYAKMLKAGEQLPDGVYQIKDYNTGEPINSFYTIYDPKLTAEEKNEYIQYRNYLNIKTIKNCMVFFTVLTVISLIGAVVLALSLQ